MKEIIIILIVGALFLSGCSATFEERDYTLDKIPPAQVETFDETYWYTGDFCFEETLDSCLIRAIWKLDKNESGAN